MTCPHCNANLEEGATFCLNCGAQLEAAQAEAAPEAAPAAAPVAEKKKVNGLAVAGFVISLVGLFCAGIICGIISVVLSAVALKQIPAKNQGGKGLAVAGLVIGIIDLATIVISWLACGSAFLALPF